MSRYPAREGGETTDIICLAQVTLRQVDSTLNTFRYAKGKGYGGKQTPLLPAGIQVGLALLRVLPAN